MLLVRRVILREYTFIALCPLTVKSACLFIGISPAAPCRRVRVRSVGANPFLYVEGARHGLGQTLVLSLVRRSALLGTQSIRLR
jgi:hypothetical protein